MDLIDFRARFSDPAHAHETFGAAPAPVITEVSSPYGRTFAETEAIRYAREQDILQRSALVPLKPAPAEPDMPRPNAWVLFMTRYNKARLERELAGPDLVPVGKPPVPDLGTMLERSRMAAERLERERAERLQTELRADHRANVAPTDSAPVVIRHGDRFAVPVTEAVQYLRANDDAYALRDGTAVTVTELILSLVPGVI